MGNLSNSNPQSWCYSLFPLSRCTGSNKGEDSSLQISKISQLSFEINQKDKPFFDLNQNILPSNNKNDKPYNGLLNSQSFHYKDSPYSRCLDQNDIQEKYKSCPEHYLNIYEGENGNTELGLVDEKIITILNESLNKMKTDINGKKSLKIVLKQALNMYEIIYIGEIIKQAKPFDCLKLDFNRTHLKDSEILPLSGILGTLQDIEGIELLLQNNHITYKAGKALIKSLEKFHDLKTFSINLSYNLELSGNALEELAEEIGNLEKLEELCLELQAVRLNTSDLFFIELLNSLNKCKLLKKFQLNVSENMLKPNILNFFLNGLKNISYQLSEIRLILNQSPLSLQEIYEISHLLEESACLKNIYLGLKECKLKSEAFEVLLIVLSKIPSLISISLDFNGNDLKSNKDSRFLVDYINPETSFPQIEEFHLSLSHCLLDKTVYENVSFVLHCVRKIKEIALIFEASEFKSKGLEQIICSLANFPQLSRLKINIKDSELLKETLEVLVIGLQHLKKLRNLKLDLRKVKVFGIKEMKDIARIILKMEGLYNINLKVDGRIKKKIAMELTSLVNMRYTFLTIGLKYQDLNKEIRNKILLNYCNNKNSFEINEILKLLEF